MSWALTISLSPQGGTYTRALNSSALPRRWEYMVTNDWCIIANLIACLKIPLLGSNECLQLKVLHISILHRFCSCQKHPNCFSGFKVAWDSGCNLIIFVVNYSTLFIFIFFFGVAIMCDLVQDFETMPTSDMLTANNFWKPFLKFK